MPDSYLVRASRDGDQFHYLWAARRCLPLLAPHSGLVAVTIEGASPEESEDASQTKGGHDEIIDIAEYFGSERLEASTLVRYMQLKHSTLQADTAWPLSGLEKTLKGFADKYRAVQSTLGKDDLAGRVEFSFVTNRPISENVRQAIEDAKKGGTPRREAELNKIAAITNLSGNELARFCSLLRLDDKQDAFWEQRNLLSQDMAGYLAGADVDAPIQLKELITRKATSEFKSNPSITKYDVLRVLKTDIEELYPAECLIVKVADAIPREQAQLLFSEIAGANGKPVIVHAEGGVGKSVFSTRIEQGMPPGSVTILYDCFGNGQYRNASRYRHRHKEALVQIANELASKGLCHPLIPTPLADSSAYLRAFHHRLQQATETMRANNPDGLLCIVVDAGDNAQIAAEEVGETRSFIRDLIRESLPDHTRLVTLCRTHRQALLDPPPEAIPLELKPFSRQESARLLLQTFPDATDEDIDEFHRLSSQNPRVQTLALSRGGSLAEILRLLGPNPTTVEDTIRQILAASIAKLKDSLGHIEGKQVDSICAGLAALRPLIPIPVLAAIAGVPEAAIRSFASDLGRPIMVTDNTIQFFDEPAESWFREQFKPQQAALVSFVAALKPIASKSAYVAAVLPQLMLEAGQFSDLVQLALSSEALPAMSPLEKRDIELQRLQFALKASLRLKRYLDASKLALRAGGEAAGDDRQKTILQDNTDLAARFLDAETIQEIVSRRSFGSGWVGSHHAYEAGLLSGNPDLLGDARSRLRTALEWLRNWSRLPNEQRRDESISDSDIAEIAYAELNIHGPARCARSLRGWTPREVSYRVGNIVAARMIDHGRFDELSDLAAAADNDLCLVMAVTSQLGLVGRQPPKPVLQRAFRLLSNPRVLLPEGNHWDAQERSIGAITPFVEAALMSQVCDRPQALALLERYMPKEPPRGLSSRHGGSRNSYLRAYTLRAQLAGQTLVANDLAYPELRATLEKEKAGHSQSQDSREFGEIVGTLLPWHELRTRALLGEITNLEVEATLTAAKETSSKARGHYYREHDDTTDEVARLWIDTLSLTNSLDEKRLRIFDDWRATFKRELYTPTLRHIVRALAKIPAMHGSALSVAKRAFELTRDERDSADSKASGYIEIARVVLSISEQEARAYFNEAVEVTNKIGEENIDRWGSILDLADRAAKPGRPAARAAYNLSRCAELSYEHVARDKHFNWDGTVRALGGLCPTSSLAILSRWRDRHFGWEARILPELVESLVERSLLSPLDALVLQGIRANWSEAELLGPALDSHVGPGKGDIAAFVYKYMAFDGHSEKTWEKLNDVCTRHGISLPDIQTRVSLEKARNERINARKDKNEPWRNHPEKEHDWDAIFTGLDLGKAEDIWQANERFRSGEPPFSQERFFDEAFRRLPAGRRADFIRSFADVAGFDLYNLRNLLERIPKDWKDNISVKPALADTVNAFAKRYCLDISKSRYYQVLPFQLASELSGVSETQIVETILTAIGETPDLVGAGRLFTLVGLLAVMVDEDEALEGLEFGLSLFDPVLKDGDGDGSWSDSLAPTGDIEGSVAGYIWGGLASPESAVRWEACHCVLAVCQLQRTKVLKRLIDLARGKTGQIFVDRGLPPYELHARLWLLLALARSAKEYQQILAPHFDFIVEAAIGGTPHVLIREYASHAALSMIEAGVVSADAALTARLRNVNASPFPVLNTGRYDRKYLGDDPEIKGDDRYYFGMDIGPDWYAPLGRCFALSQKRVEHDALAVIRDEWGHKGTSRWDEDERHKRGYFRDMKTYARHSSYPEVDDYQFYLAYHAMMIVAGRFLATFQVHRSPNETEDDDFKDWLNRHRLTRKDGYWLADRRDPPPLEQPAWKDEESNDDWPWSLRKGDFDVALNPNENTYTLWGYWTNVDDRREEHIHISSALVSPEKSQSLLRALQSTRNPHDYRIPDAGDDLEIDHGKFRLKGWIASHTRDRELDRFDPWSGSISYPPPRPAFYIKKLLGLSSDIQARQWRIGDEKPGLTSSVWGHFKEKTNDEGERESGSRLQATKEFIVELLARTGMRLIVEVEINRKIGSRRYDYSSKEPGFEYPLQSARLFIIDEAGRYVSI